MYLPTSVSRPTTLISTLLPPTTFECMRLCKWNACVPGLLNREERTALLAIRPLIYNTTSNHAAIFLNFKTSLHYVYSSLATTAIQIHAFHMPHEIHVCFLVHAIYIQVCTMYLGCTIVCYKLHTKPLHPLLLTLSVFDRMTKCQANPLLLLTFFSPSNIYPKRYVHLVVYMMHIRFKIFKTSASFL